MDAIDDHFPDRLKFPGLANYTETPAQEIMRHEMSLGQVLDEVVGPQESQLSEYGEFDRKVPNLALDIIAQHDLVLSLKQWHTVQAMIEQGIRIGWETGKG